MKFAAVVKFLYYMLAYSLPSLGKQTLNQLRSCISIGNMYWKSLFSDLQLLFHEKSEKSILKIEGFLILLL